jgi:hypothetical protein
MSDNLIIGDGLNDESNQKEEASKLNKEWYERDDRLQMPRFRLIVQAVPAEGTRSVTSRGWWKKSHQPGFGQDTHDGAKEGDVKAQNPQNGDAPLRDRNVDDVDERDPS